MEKTCNATTEGAQFTKSNNDDKQRNDCRETECKAPTPSPVVPAEKEKAVTPCAAATPFVPKKATKIQPKKTPARKTNTKSKKDSPMLLEAISQAMALQAFEYQHGMSEEDALKEAFWLFEMEDSMRRPSRTKQPSSHLLSEPTAATSTPAEGDIFTKTKELKKMESKNAVASGEHKQPAMSPSSSFKTPKETPAKVELSGSDSAVNVRPASPEDERPVKRSRSIGAKADPGLKAAKKRKTTTTSPRAEKQAGQGNMMFEEDALLLTLKMSEIEY